MKRTNLNKKADLILTGDWHLREDTPVCRTDNSEETQWRKVRFVSDLQEQHDCDVIHSGDLFNHWKPSPYLISKTMVEIPQRFFSIYGNHDLPQHNLELQLKSGMYALWVAGKIGLLTGTHWNQKPVDPTLVIRGKRILVWHVMTYQAKKLWPDMTDPKAITLLRKYSDYDLILTGHNHQSFVEEYKGRLLVNPGSIMRMDADQLDATPRVYLYYANTNTVEPVYIPIEKGAVSRDHLDKVKERSDRIEAFVSRLKGDWGKTLGFEENLEQFFQANKVDPAIHKIIYKSLEND